MAHQQDHLHSSLHFFDSKKWKHRRNYSPALAEALRSAYSSIHDASSQPGGYFDAYVALMPFRTGIFCLEQRLHLEYALALAYTGESAFPQALDCLSRALDIALALGDQSAQAELGLLAGADLHMLSLNAKSYDLYADALDALRQLQRDETPADPRFELDLLLRLAGCAWELGWFPVCLRHLDEAYALRARWVSAAPSEAARLAWLDAQLARVLGKPVHALKQSAAAAQLLLESEGGINAGRIHTIQAECALDIVDYHRFREADASVRRYNPTSPSLAAASLDVPFYDVPDPEAALAQARTAARTALNLARNTYDEIGVGMARLVQRRLDRALGRYIGEQRAITEIERVLRIGHRAGDVALVGRAHTALGEEFAAAGRPDNSRNAFVAARHALEEFGLGGLACWPIRALRDFSGM